MADNKKKEYVQVRIPDKERLSRLLNELKGQDRTMAQYAEDCGNISASTLSRILNGKISKPLSLDVLRMLYDHRADGVNFDFDVLAGANGMAIKTDEGELPAYRRSVIDRREKEYAIQTMIGNELFDRGKMIRVVRNPLRFSDKDKNPEAPDYGLLLHEDFRIEMQENDVKKGWIFEVNMDSPETSRFFNVNRRRYPDKELTDEQKENLASRDMIFTINRLYASNFLIDAWQPEYMEGVKFSYVFISEPYYNAFRRLLRNAQFHNEVTTILVDVDDQKVIKEEWMQCPQAKDARSIFDEPVQADVNQQYGEGDGHQFFFFFGDNQGEGE